MRGDFNMINIAWAVEVPKAFPALQFVPFLLVILVFYFLIIRPQQKKAKQHLDFLKSLQRGDQVVTASGIYGTVTGIADAVITLEVAEDVRIKVAKPHISGKAPQVTG